MPGKTNYIIKLISNTRVLQPILEWELQIENTVLLSSYLLISSYLIYLLLALINS